MSCLFTIFDYDPLLKGEREGCLVFVEYAPLFKGEEGRMFNLN